MIESFNARDLSMFAWGLAKLNVLPPEAFLGKYVQRVEVMAGEFPPQEVANTVWALACFNVRPSSVLLAQLFDATDQRLSSFKAQELSQMIWALADRRCVLDRQWVNEFLKVSFLRMGDFSGQGLANVAWSLQRLSISPPPAWVYSYVGACRRQMAAGRMSALDLGTVVNALKADRKLQKVDDFVVDALDALSTMELGSQAYTQQQLRYFSRLRGAVGVGKEAAEAGWRQRRRRQRESASVSGSDASIAESAVEGETSHEASSSSNGHVLAIPLPERSAQVAHLSAAFDSSDSGTASETDVGSLKLSLMKGEKIEEGRRKPRAVSRARGSADVEADVGGSEAPLPENHNDPCTPAGGSGKAPKRRQRREGGASSPAVGHEDTQRVGSGTWSVQFPSEVRIELPDMDIGLGEALHLSGSVLSAHVYTSSARRAALAHHSGSSSDEEDKIKSEGSLVGSAR